MHASGLRSLNVEVIDSTMKTPRVDCSLPFPKVFDVHHSITMEKSTKLDKI